MILQAEKVSQDCREALDDFTDGLQGGRWRRHWILCLTLIRCVDHVLKEVDGASDRTSKKLLTWSIKNSRTDSRNLEFFGSLLRKKETPF
jgi:hypothetical protein